MSTIGDVTSAQRMDVTNSQNLQLGWSSNPDSNYDAFAQNMEARGYNLSSVQERQELQSLDAGEVGSNLLAVHDDHDGTVKAPARRTAISTIGKSTG